MYDAGFSHAEGKKRQFCSKAIEPVQATPSASQLMAGFSQFVWQLLFQLEL